MSNDSDTQSTHQTLASNPLKSRTFWAALLSLITVLHPDARLWLEANDIDPAAAVGGILLALKFITFGWDNKSTWMSKIRAWIMDIDAQYSSSAPSGADNNSVGSSHTTDYPEESGTTHPSPGKRNLPLLLIGGLAAGTLLCSSCSYLPESILTQGWDYALERNPDGSVSLEYKGEVIVTVNKTARK